MAIRLLSIACLLVLSTACTYQLAMRRGAALSHKGDWEGAYEAYQTAAEHKPDDPEVAAKLKEARDKVIAGAITESRAALARSDWEAAVGALRRAEKYNQDDPELYTELNLVEEALKAALERDWQTTDPREIYSLAVRAQKLFPKAAYLPPMFEHLRKHFLQQSETLLKSEQFAFSLAALRTITEFEPDRASIIAPLEARVNTAWADDLVAQAAKHAKTGKTGAAAILYARAHEVGSRQADLVQARKLSAGLASSSRLTVKLEVDGIPARAASIKTAVQSGLGGIGELDVVTAGTPKLGLKLTVAAHRCTETDTVTPSTKDYISGQVEKPNPEHQRLTTELAAAMAEEKAAKAEAEKLWPVLQAASAELAKVEASLQAAQTTFDQAEAAYDEAEKQLASARQRRDEIQAQLDSGSGDKGALQQQLNEQAKLVAQWTDALLDREDKSEAARKALAKLREPHEPLLNKKEQLQTSYQALTTRRTTAQDLTGKLSAQLTSTPKTLWEDVHETLKYDIHDWQRTCTAPTSGAVTPAWTTQLPKTHRFAPAFRTTDRSHIGHRLSGLVEDPKSFPDTDASLVALGDAETAKETIAWVTALANDYYVRKVEDAVRTWTTSPVDASTTIVGLYLGAPARLSPETLTSFQEGVKAQFGLEKLELLKP